MVEAWILTIFCLFLCIPIVISERQKPTQRQKYDAVVKHMLMIYADGDEIPVFMNKRAWNLAHRKAIQIAQEGKLNKCYEMIRRGAL
jgi:hypothetical protein|nr:MAG TPA: hypothetical protein [Caudoviricetes sp.]